MTLSIPDELLVHILSFTGSYMLVTRYICRRWRTCVKSLIWQQPMCCKHIYRDWFQPGSINFLLWAHQQDFPITSKAQSSAVRSGDPFIVKWWFDVLHHEIDRVTIKQAARSGNFPIFEFLYDKLDDDDKLKICEWLTETDKQYPKIIKHVAKLKPEGYTDQFYRIAARWGYECQMHHMYDYDEGAITDKVWIAAAESGYWSIIEWLMTYDTRTCIYWEEMLKAAVNWPKVYKRIWDMKDHPQFEISDIVGNPHDTVFVRLIKADQLDLLIWTETKLRKSVGLRHIWNDWYGVERAARDGNIRILEWLHQPERLRPLEESRKRELSRRISSAAAEGPKANRLETLRWLKSNGYTISDSSIFTVIMRKEVDILEQLQTLNVTIFTTEEHAERALTAAVRWGCPATVDWILCRKEFSSETLGECYVTAAERSSLTTLKILVSESKTPIPRLYHLAAIVNAIQQRRYHKAQWLIKIKNVDRESVISKLDTKFKQTQVLRFLDYVYWGS